MQFFLNLGPPGLSKDPSDFKINFILNKAAPSVLSIFEEVVESL